LHQHTISKCPGYLPVELFIFRPYHRPTNSE
jgi:hypothetical protein